MRAITRGLCVLVVLAVLGIAQPPAYAGPGSQNYNVTRCVYLPGVGAYAMVDASGTISFVRSRHPTGRYFYYDVKVTNPSVSLASRSGCGRTSPLVTRKKAEITQGFYANDCNSNSGLSVSVPWGVSVNPTFNCGSSKVGVRSTSYGSGNLWTQNNSGAPVVWNDDIGGAVSNDPGYPCIRMTISVTLYQAGGSSDTAVWGDNEALQILSC